MGKEAILKEVYESSFNDEIEKIGGVISETLSGLNPLNIFAGYPAAIAATITPTKTKEQMKEQQKKTWSNLLVPGAGTYRALKRLGYSQKSLNEENKKK